MSEDSAQAKKGFTAALTAFAVWGAFPVYFHSLHLAPALQVIAHRIVWSLAFVLIWMYFRNKRKQNRAA